MTEYFCTATFLFLYNFLLYRPGIFLLFLLDLLLSVICCIVIWTCVSSVEYTCTIIVYTHLSE